MAYKFKLSWVSRQYTVQENFSRELPQFTKFSANFHNFYSIAYMVHNFPRNCLLPIYSSIATLPACSITII